MIERLRRRLSDQIGTSPTFVAEGVKFSGDIETSGPLVVCGSVRGDGQVAGALHLTATSRWHGEVHARAAIVSGQFTGRLVIEEKVEIGASAVIHADIVAGRIAVARGAIIDGAVTVTSGEAVVQFEERRDAGS